MKVNFNESSLPQMFSQSLLKLSQPLDFSPEHAFKEYEVMFRATADFLKIMKTDSKKTALAINDIKGNLIMAAILTFHESADSEMPGNYSFEFTTDVVDLEDAKVFDNMDPKYMMIVKKIAASDHNMGFKQDSFLIDMIVTAASSLINWLDVNAKADEEVEITLEGTFTAAAAIEGDVKVFSITPDGAVKMRVKDDAAIEMN